MPKRSSSTTSEPLTYKAARALVDSIPDAYLPGILPLCRPDCTFHSQQFPICPSPGKTPNIKGYTKRAVAQYEKARIEELTYETLADAAAQWLKAGHNLGLVPPPNVVVMDADDASGVAWIRRNRETNVGVQTRSAKSEHSFFRYDEEDWPARNTTYKVDVGAKSGKLAAIDLRCPGKGFVVIPPSMHKDGNRYTWSDPLPESPEDLPPVPEKIADAFLPLFRPKSKEREADALVGHDLVRKYVNRQCRYASGEDPIESIKRIRAAGAQLAHELYEADGRPERAKDMCRPGGELDRMVESAWDEWGADAPIEEDASDAALAGLILHELIDDWRHIPTEPNSRCWRVWDGESWKMKSDGVIRDGIRLFNEVLHDDSMREGDKPRSERLAKMAQRLRMSRNIDAVYKMLSNDSRLFAELTDFDTNPWLLGFPQSDKIPAMTLDLQSGEAHEARKNDHITLLMGAPFDPDAQNDLFERYLESSIPEVELREWVQHALGASLPGVQADEAFFFLHGLGASGKGLLLGSVCKAMGDYGVLAQPSTFSGDGPVTGGGAEPDLMNLKGKRFVYVDEISDIKRIGSRMKNLTGGSVISARGLYQSEIVSFEPQHSVWLAGNQQPKASAEDSGIWRRAKEIPMNHGGATGQVDVSLKWNLKQSDAQAAIVAWMLEGADMARDNGWMLGESVVVTEATQSFRDASDPIGEWFSECIEGVASARESFIGRSALFSHYEKWMDDQYGAGSRREVSRANVRGMAGALRRRGGVEHKRNGVRGWLGFRLRGMNAAPDDTDTGKEPRVRREPNIPK